MEARWRVSFLLILVVLSGLTFWNYNNRVYDWDMPGYVGCLYASLLPDSPEKVKDLTFESIKKEASASQYADIIGISPVDEAKQAFEKDTQSFTEQLPYFQIKVGYNLMISFLYELGISAPMSVLFSNLISFFLSGILIFYLFKIIFPNNYFIAIGITTIIVILPPMTGMSREPTPDMFIFQFLLVLAIALLKRWSKWTIFLILLSITFTRPDYIPFTLSYVIVSFLFKYYHYKKVDLYLIAQGILLFVLYLGVIKFYNYPGWKDIFYDSFIYRRPTISAQPALFTLEDYLRILFDKIIYFKKVSLVSLSILGGLFYFTKDRWIRTYSVFIFANIYIKFLFFPHSAEIRFFFGFIMLLFIMLMYTLSKKYDGFKLNKIA